MKCEKEIKIIMENYYDCINYNFDMDVNIDFYNRIWIQEDGIRTSIEYISMSDQISISTYSDNINNKISDHFYMNDDGESYLYCLFKYFNKYYKKNIIREAKLKRILK